MARYVSFRDGGQTDEEGISRYISKFLDGDTFTGLAVTQQGPLALGVAVSAGDIMIDSGNDYPYIAWSDANINVSLATADGTNPRYDLIVAYIDLAIVDDTNPNNPNAFVVDNITGTPAGSPVEPNLAAIEAVIGVGNPYVILARVTVGAGVTTISNSVIVDRRDLVSLSLEGDISGASLSLTQNIDVADTKAIRDGNDNELIKFSQTASAVNEITVKNAATGSGPEIQASGGDSNIDVELVPKGTGAVTNGTQKIDWYQELARTTLSGAGDTITVNSIPARKYLKIYVSVAATGGNMNVLLSFNNDTGTNYSRRTTIDGAADTSGASATSIQLQNATDAHDKYVEITMLNIATKEKIFHADLTSRNATGAATAPSRTTTIGKWANTANQVTRIDITNGSTGDYAIGSEVVVLGHD